MRSGLPATSSSEPKSIFEERFPTGTYTLRIEAQGFKANETKGITLTAGQQARQTYSLDVGSISEMVSIAGTAPLPNAVLAEQQQSIDGSEVAQLPLQRRNVSNILPVGAGVSNAGGLRMNGFGRNGTVYSVDGTSASGNAERRSASTYGNFSLGRISRLRKSCIYNSGRICSMQ